MRIAQLLFLLLLNQSALLAQTGVAIGGNTVDGSAVMDMSKTKKGVLIPRLTQSARLTMNSPAEGLLVYDSTSNRMYQYQDGVWRYLVNNLFWMKSLSGNYIFSADSVGLGTISPDKRLEVIGNIRGRSSLLADATVAAGNNLQGDNIISSGNLGVGGTATIAGNITVQGNTTIDNTSPLLQLEEAGQAKAFMQASGNDLRMGTNSGNSSGNTIIRMNGTDIISIDTTSSFRVLTASGGNISMGPKLTRSVTGNENMIPILYGKVFNNNADVWMSTNGVVTKTGTGIYEVQSFSARISLRSSFIVTVINPLPYTANAYLLLTGFKFIVEITDAITGNHVDADFSFIVTDPLNLFN
jgi:hypothetical protein